DVYPRQSEDIRKGTVGSDKIMRLLRAEKPYGLFVAHKHLRGSCNPSENDDRFTASIGFLCSISNTRLMDHLIYYTDKEVYSYLLSGKLDDINATFTFNKVMDEQLEKFSGDKRDV
ncbi:MAG: hypothetical protein K2N30_01610, partial [Clostridia bacterium]|nr:hypothetical protein [Clostridia bacterium]